MEKKEEDSNIYIKDYRIIERIGFGAHSIVYKSIKKNNNKIFVIKQIPLFKKNINKIEEVKNEALILKQLNCEFIVKYYESFEINNFFYIIMEYCEKGNLSSLIINLKKKNKHLTENQIWKFFIQICIGLSYIHNKKILHRDLKTKNIFLTKNLNIKIGDLGIAKILEEKNYSNTLIGTPFYLSPEICEEKPYNEKSDIWALGCILYELINFKHPFNASNQAALLLKIINGNYEKFNYEISDDLKQIVCLLLEKNIKLRPYISDIIRIDIFIKKTKEFGFSDFFDKTEKKNEEKKIKNKKIIKIDNINCKKIEKNNNKNYKDNIHLDLRNKRINNFENNSSKKDYYSFYQNNFSSSNIMMNEKNFRTSSIEYNLKSTSSSIRKILIKSEHKNKDNCVPNNNLNGSDISLKKISSKYYNKKTKKIIKNSAPTIKKISTCNSFRIKNRVNSNKKQINIQSNTSKINVHLFKNNKPQIKYLNTYNSNRDNMNNEIKTDRFNNKKTGKEKINLKHQNMFKKNNHFKQLTENILNKENKNLTNIYYNDNTYIHENKENDSFEIIEPNKEKKFRLTLSNTKLKDESESFDEEKVLIINDNFKYDENKEKIIIEKYNQLKKEIYYFNNQINCDKLIEMYNNIDTNFNNKKIDDITLEIDNYIKLQLPKNIIPKFKKIFNKLCYYGLQLRYSKIKFSK